MLMKIFTNRFASLFLVFSSVATAAAVDFGDISIEDMTFKPAGTAEYTDCFFKTFFEQQYGASFSETFGMDAYTTTVVLEESEQISGYYRLVHPYKQLCEEIIPLNETWAYGFYYMEESDYMRINAIDRSKAYVDSYLMENSGIYPMDGIYEYETPLYPSSAAWWQSSDGEEINPDYFLVNDGDTFTVKPTPAEDFDTTNPTNTATPLFTVAMWTDPVSYGTVERYFPASVGTCDFKLVLHLDNSAIDEISAETLSATGGKGFISFGASAEGRVSVYSLNGTEIYNGVPQTIAATPGLYIVKSGAKAVKVIVK